MPILDHVALFKFSVDARAGNSHVAAIANVQALIEETGQFADGIGCESLRLFNYLFCFAPRSAIKEISCHVATIQPASCYRQLGAVLGAETDRNRGYICWLMAAVDHLIKRNVIAASCRDETEISLQQYQSMLEQVPERALIEATFVPTVSVNGSGFGIGARFPNRLDLTKLELAIEHEETDGNVLLLLDGDGIKKAREDAYRPTLFAMHEQSFQAEGRYAGGFDDKMMHIYRSRLALDGLFDRVVSQIVRQITSAGHEAQYLGGDELVAIAPVDIVSDAVEAACADAPFEIAFSCGASELSAFRRLEEGFSIAEHKLGQAKLLARRGAFNFVP